MMIKQLRLLLIGTVICSLPATAQSKISAADSMRYMQLYQQMKKDTGMAAMGRMFSDPTLMKRKDIPQAWSLPSETAYNTSEAELVVRIGDIDNFGFGWDLGYDPFSGNPTNTSHAFPFQPGKTDVPPTDRIMIPTGFNGVLNPQTSDGYTRTTKRPGNLPRPFVLKYDLRNIALRVVKLQLFADDFQAPRTGSFFRVLINQQRVPYLESMLNSLNQTGPIGKLLTLSIDPVLFPEIQKDSLSIFIDDPVHNVGDGYAIDFIRLLINPKDLPSGTIAGFVLDRVTRKPLSNATVSIGDNIKATSDSRGAFTLFQVPAGLAVMSTMKDGYSDTSINRDLAAGKTIDNIEIYLSPNVEGTASMKEDLKKKGRTAVYNILFDPGKAVIKPSSLSGLNQVLDLIHSLPNNHFTISGHTDNTGEERQNLQLSQARADAVVKWLVEKGIAQNQLTAKGYGAAMPVATNDTEEGKARNRRVQLDINE